MNKRFFRFTALGYLAAGLAMSVIATHSAPVQPGRQEPALSPNFQPAYTLPAVGLNAGLVLSHNGQVAAYFGSKANVTVVDLASRKVLWQQVEMFWETDRMAVSSNGVYLAGTGLEQNPGNPKGEWLEMVYIVNMQTRKVLKVPGSSLSLAFSPDSKSLVVARAGDNGVVLYHIKTGKKTHILRKEPLTAYMDSSSIKFSPDAKLLAIGSAGGNSDGHVRVWNFGSGKLIRDFTNAYTPMVFSPDSKLLATSANDPQPEHNSLPPGAYSESARFAFQDFAVKVWSLTNSGQHVLKHKGRQTEATAADPQAFSSDGQLLLTTNGDLWDVKTRKFAGRRAKLGERGRELQFARDGTFVTTVKKTK